MAKSYTLKIFPCYNPYQLSSTEGQTNGYVKNIAFYDSSKGEQLFTTGKGWLGSNNKGSKLDTLHYKRKIKVDLKSKESFFVRDTLYVEINHLGGFRYIGEVVHYDTEEETSYINKFEIDGEVYNAGRCTRTVLKPFGERVRALAHMLEHTEGTYGARQLLQNDERRQELIKLLLD